MEERVHMFYKLHNNKWFHIFNFTLEVIKMTNEATKMTNEATKMTNEATKMTNTNEKVLLIKYGQCFFSPMGILN
jgi:hypothetical protein